MENSVDLDQAPPVETNPGLHCKVIPCCLNTYITINQTEVRWPGG